VHESQPALVLVVFVVGISTFDGHWSVFIPMGGCKMVELACLWTDFPGQLEFGFKAVLPFAEWCHQFKFIVSGV